MSYLDTQTTTTKSPIERYFEWNGSLGQPKFWNGSENELIKLPFNMILLGTRASVTGFDSDSNSRVYSNFINNTSTDELYVRNSNGIIAQGLWNDVKGTIGEKGKFSQNLFFVFTDASGENKLGMFTIKGSAMGAWIDFVKEDRNSLYTNVISLASVLDKKKGATKYKVPVFSVGTVVSDAQVQVAKEFAQVLNEYLSPTETVQEVTETAGVSLSVDDLDEDDLPF